MGHCLINFLERKGGEGGSCGESFMKQEGRATKRGRDRVSSFFFFFFFFFVAEVGRVDKLGSLIERNCSLMNFLSFNSLLKRIFLLLRVESEILFNLGVEIGLYERNGDFV